MAGVYTIAASIQDALKTAINAQTPGVTVTIGYPTGGPADEHIWISGEPHVVIDNNVSTLKQRDETVELDVFIQAVGMTNDYTVKRDRALVLAKELEDALTADRTLGGIVNEAVTTDYQFHELVEDRKRGQGLVIHVVCEWTAS